jgi:hypothetical protein
MDRNWDALKVYQNLRQDSLLALFDAANAAGASLVGHVPSMRAPAAVILRGRFLVPDSIAN